MVEATQKLLIPTIHLNGTSKERLLEAIEQAHHALNEAMQALAETAPNGRDYYPQGPDVIYKAVEQHSARMQKLLDVKHELEQIAEALPV